MGTDSTFRRARLAAALVLGFAFAPAAWAHAKLIAAEPKAEATVATAPSRIRLQFNDHVELPFSKIKLIDTREVAIEAGAVGLDPADPKTLVATVPQLPSGQYRVQWSTVTRDGHKVKGEYSFSVK